MLIKPVSCDQFHEYAHHLSDVVVVTHDRKILMQKRPNSWRTFPGVVNFFGGHVEKGETFCDAAIREIDEELGAKIISSDIEHLVSLTEQVTNHQELVHVSLWHDAHRTIEGVFEAEEIVFENIDEALKHPKLMAYASYILNNYRDKIQRLLV